MELKLFVEIVSNISQKCILSVKNAANLGLPQGGSVILVDPALNTNIACTMEPDSEVLDFSVRVAKDVLTQINFTGLEIIILSNDDQNGASIPAPNNKSQPPINIPPSPILPPTPSTSNFPTIDLNLNSSTAPAPNVPPMQTPQVPPMQAPQVPPMQAPQVPPMQTPQVPPMQTPQVPPMQTPQVPPMQTPQVPPMQAPPMPVSQMPPMQTPTVPNSQMAAPQSSVPQSLPPLIEVDPYPNRIPISQLANQTPNSAILIPKISKKSLSGKIVINAKTATQLNLYPNAIAGWEDHLTRSTGSARVEIMELGDGNVGMDENTIFDTNVKAPQLVVYSLEPPIVPVESLSLEVESKPDLGGFIEINHRNAQTLQVTEGDILSFEDELTGAFGAGKVRFNPNVQESNAIIDQELVEASGVGSFEVELKKNIRQIIPLQSIELGVSPISGENVWEIISMARENIDVVKKWLSNYIIYKGIKLRWKSANIAIEVLNTVPDLSGDVLASISPSTAIELKPVSLITFNAILVIDISRSMMARDVRVTNIGPALEGIKSAMHDPEIQDFLAKFKPGTNVPRRLSAAFSAILFLSEKVGRGFGERVSVIRFADEAQILPMSAGKLWMDSSSGQKGELENCARLIVREIGNAYGQATNMGLAMQKAQELLNQFSIDQPDQPTMIVLLTDGNPTDGTAFLDAIDKISENQNVVLYIIGLGNLDDGMMKKAAVKCAGEYFKPEDSGELLVWYSKRARDLTLKLRREEKK
ncbi:VWA domain-containing protein [Candidatus Lokiarchaeum ossiferum]|uniref:VWA domain-containing protein n=1 Tax=Candidatus Lokiarchaeum ossiferum TaxID=2951803 RepID=UPI00352C040D